MILSEKSATFRDYALMLAASVHGRTESMCWRMALQAQGRREESIVFKTWPEAMHADRTAFASLSEYRVPLASVVPPAVNWYSFP